MQAVEVRPLQPVDKLPLAPALGQSPVMAMIAQAVAAGQSLDVIRELKDMAKELAADEARRAFDAALAEAKGKIPVITKNKHVGFESRKAGGSSTDYWHEDLGQIVRTVDPILRDHGLAYRFVPDQSSSGIKVTCVLTGHGHAESFTLMAAADNTGNKNSIQQVGSTLTYLQRYTLKMALGLAASMDDDGRKSEAVDVITDEQRTDLLDLMEEVGFTDADDARLMKVFKVQYLANLASKDYQRAVDLVKAKQP